MTTNSNTSLGFKSLAILIAFAGPAMAEEAVPASAEDKAPAAADSLFERDTLTGDWGGVRSGLAEDGVTLGLKYTGEMFANPKGGAHSGADYEHQVLGTLDLDFGKLAGLEGATAHVGAVSVNDHGPSARHVGNALDVSNIEWRDQTRLWTAWVQQTAADGMISLRVGQLSSDDEFDVSSTAGGLLNSTFGSNASVFANLPAGIHNAQGLTLGPAYPLGAPGARLQIVPNENWAWLTGVFSAQPASADRNGLQFNIDGGALVMSELQYQENQDKDATGLPVAYKLGGWYDSGKLNDQSINTTGGTLAFGGTPRQDRGDWSIYGVADRTIWRDDSGQAVSVFTRVNLVPQDDRNLVTLYVDGGAGLKGLVPGRDSDLLTIGAAYAGVGKGARTFDKDSGTAVRNGEAVVEVAYQAQFAPWWAVIPDAQYVIHPAYGAHDPASPASSARIPDAVVTGIRTVLTF